MTFRQADRTAPPDRAYPEPEVPRRTELRGKPKTRNGSAASRPNRFRTAPGGSREARSSYRSPPDYEFATDSVYLNVSLDDPGLPLNGGNRYEIRFEKGQQPPVKAFWSITMYNLQYNLVANPINRYSLGDRSGMKAAPDGSLTIYLQSEPPGDDRLSNWLPAPKQDFFLILRAYLPGPTMLDQTWRPPAVTRMQ